MAYIQGRRYGGMGARSLRRRILGIFVGDRVTDHNKKKTYFVSMLKPRCHVLWNNQHALKRVDQHTIFAEVVRELPGTSKGWLEWRVWRPTRTRGCVADRPVESHSRARETFLWSPFEGKINFLNGAFWCTLYFSAMVGPQTSRGPR